LDQAHALPLMVRLYTARDDGLVVIERMMHDARDLGELLGEAPPHGS
jgi:hypothetical protein